MSNSRIRYVYVGDGHRCSVFAFSKESAIASFKKHYSFEINPEDVIEDVKLNDNWR
jgi:hypothetical protein